MSFRVVLRSMLHFTGSATLNTCDSVGAGAPTARKQQNQRFPLPLRLLWLLLFLPVLLLLPLLLLVLAPLLLLFYRQGSNEVTRCSSGCASRSDTIFSSFFFPFFPHPIYYLCPFCSLPPSRNSDPGSHSRLFSPPTHYDSCLAFLWREDFSSFFPRRLASNHAYPR